MSKVKVTGIWTIREKVVGVDGGEVWLVRARRKNLFTYYGLTQLASAIGGNYTPPNYLVIDPSYVTNNGALSVGNTSVALSSDPTITGDTQLVLGVGLGSQEVVTFTSKTGSTFTLSPGVVNVHAANEKVVRMPNANDAIAQMSPEAQYDSIYAPGTRIQSVSGYSTGVGNYTIQFYLTGNQATNVGFITIGLSDTPLTNQGNLHNATVLGYTHSTTNDVEIDGSITLSNI